VSCSQRKTPFEEQVQTNFADVTDVFEFDSSSMAYHDGPWAGWMRSRDTGDWYAFVVQFVVSDCVWHWILVRGSKDESHTKVIEQALAARSGPWVSIVEDRRGDRMDACRMQELDLSVARPVYTLAKNT
jgi:hypothetical protein